jgi:hypothetical protein
MSDVTFLPSRNTPSTGGEKLMAETKCYRTIFKNVFMWFLIWMAPSKKISLIPVIHNENDHT